MRPLGRYESEAFRLSDIIQSELASERERLKGAILNIIQVEYCWTLGRAHLEYWWLTFIRHKIKYDKTCLF